MIAVWILVGIAGLVLVWGVILQLPKTRGWAMELSVAALLALLPKRDYTVINNLFFRTGRSTCQIDHLVISRFGIFVIETKNYLGVIRGYGNEKMLSRRVLGMKYRTRNPIDQNDWHVRYLLDHFPLVRQHADALIPMVVFNFSSSVRIRKAPCPVCKIQSLLKTIKGFNKTVLDSVTLERLTEEIQEQNRNHRKRIW